MEGQGVNKYLECQHIPKALTEEITEAQALSLPYSKVENVLPLFERKISDYKRIKLCSLETNEVLKCQWKNYLRNSEGVKVAPFQFPSLGDLHFHNNRIKFMPSLSPGSWQNVRKQMGIGPGIDTYGQIPIPQTHKGVSKTKAKKPKEPIRTKAKPVEYAKPLESAKTKAKPVENANTKHVESTKAKQQ